MDKLKLLLGSRKFWALLVGLAYFVIGQVLPEFAGKLPPEESALAFVVLIVGYIIGTALEDGLRG